MISAVILTKNEEQNIVRCLESVKWCDEIIIIDDKSIDKTIEIAKKYKPVIYKRPLKSNFSVQRNYGLDKAKNEWVLFVDSDEVISDALAYEISTAIAFKDQRFKDFNGYYIKRKDFMWGKVLEHGDSHTELLRLAKKNAGTWKGKAHERWDINSRVGKLVNPMLHFPHKNLEEFLREINFYTDIRAGELKEKNVKSSFFSILLYPSLKFIQNFILKKGFSDGLRGLISALVMSFHSFLVRGKLWLEWQKS